jgi:isocitrate dehydrogenase kinase/phosphatase
LPEPAQSEFLEHHGDLFGPEFWRAVQEKLRAGELPEIFPYRPERRLSFS